MSKHQGAKGLNPVALSIRENKEKAAERRYPSDIYRSPLPWAARKRQGGKTVAL
jgi:hypothetical protein